MAIPGLQNIETRERKWENNPHFKDIDPNIARAMTQLQGTKPEPKIENHFLKSNREELSILKNPDSLVEKRSYISPDNRKAERQMDVYGEVKGFARGIAGVVKDSIRFAHGFFNILQGGRPTKFEAARNKYKKKSRTGGTLDRNYAKGILKSAFPDTDLSDIDTKIVELERDGIDKNSREIKFLKDIKNSL